MQNIRKMSALLGAGAVIFGLAGCGGKDAENAVANNMEQTGNAAVKGVDAVGNGVAGAGEAVVNGAKDLGQAASNVAVTTEKALDGATLTPQIKTAFGGNKALNGSTIDVDTDTTAKTVTLKGTVTSAAQKKLAETIAKQKATGFKVVNNLTMKGKM